MFDACHTEYNIKVYNLECSLYREGTKKEKKEKPEDEETEEVEKKRRMVSYLFAIFDEQSKSNIALKYQTFGPNEHF